ncbi:hypothetical protein [Dactylosporangium sp. NPDC049140]|uniref:hypothetical protein n=1 Tax=Dactylosporangium sp. NPDC049140 TaxID=3155647 RepID=UPI0033CA936E
MQRRLDELGDQVPEYERARAGMLVQEARIGCGTLTNDLLQILFGLQSSAQQQTGGGQPAGQEAEHAAGRSSGSVPADDVIDADFSGG